MDVQSVRAWEKSKHLQINYAIKWCKLNNINIDAYYILCWNTYNTSENEELVKISKNRLRYFFPKKDGVSFIKLQVSNIGDYSITPSTDSHRMATILYHQISTCKQSNYIITDATCGNAGNTIHFAYLFNKVNAVDISKLHYDITHHNISVYNLKNVNIIHADYLQIMYKLNQDVIFIDPPWGGPKYKNYNKVPLYLGDQSINIIINNIIKKKCAKLIGIKIPHNFDVNSLYKYINSKQLSIYNFKKCKLITILM